MATTIELPRGFTLTVYANDKRGFSAELIAPTTDAVRGLDADDLYEMGRAFNVAARRVSADDAPCCDEEHATITDAMNCPGYGGNRNIVAVTQCTSTHPRSGQCLGDAHHTCWHWNKYDRWSGAEPHGGNHK